MKTNFSWTHYNKADIEALKGQIINTYKSNLNEIVNILPEHRTFENTVLAMNRLDYFNSQGVNDYIYYGDVMLQIHLLSNVHHDADIRKAAQDLEECISSQLIDITMNKDLYVAMQEYMHGNYEVELKHNKKKVETNSNILNLIELRDEEKLIIKDTNLALSRMGFQLPENKFKKLKKISKELATVSSKFRININNYQDYILATREELDGCSERYISSLATVSGSSATSPLPLGKGSGDGILYKVTLSYPDSIPFMSYAKDRKKRKELSDKISQKGGKENLKVLNKMLTLRSQISDILGYDNYVNYKVEDRMAHNLENVTELLNRVKDNIKDKVKDDINALKVHAKSIGIKDFKYYDQAFVSRSLEEHTYNIDKESLRPYFETDRVIKYMLDLFGDLFAFKYEEVNAKDIDFKLWDKDVKIYKILNDSKKYKLTNTGKGEVNKDELMSYLILDLYPREGKYGHAAAFNTVEHGDKVIALVCNFPAPKAAIASGPPSPLERGLGGEAVSTPSLLSLDEVETLYHEFGHATHFMLADTEYPEHNGFHVAWDFVETPSQMLEEWVYNEAELKKLGRHYQTGETLSDEIIKNILDSRKYMSGYGWMRQITMSQFDLDIHLGKHKKASTNKKSESKKMEKKTANSTDKEGMNVEKYYQNMLKKNIGLDINEKSLFPASFGHLDGYDSGYYSYLWAKVYAVDFYSIFEKAKNNQEKSLTKNKKSTIKNSDLNKDKEKIENINDIGLRYRKEVLGAGSSRDELVTAKAFLGRKLSDKAFVRSL